MSQAITGLQFSKTLIFIPVAIVRAEKSPIEPFFFISVLFNWANMYSIYKCWTFSLMCCGHTKVISVGSPMPALFLSQMCHNSLITTWQTELLFTACLSRLTKQAFELFPYVSGKCCRCNHVFSTVPRTWLQYWVILFNVSSFSFLTLDVCQLQNDIHQGCCIWRLGIYVQYPVSNVVSSSHINIKYFINRTCLKREKFLSALCLRRTTYSLLAVNAAWIVKTSFWIKAAAFTVCSWYRHCIPW